MTPILTPTEMAAVDAAATVPVTELVDRAGRAVARAAVDMMGGTYGRVVNVIAGPGNNGADGRVAATCLRRRGVQVHVVDASACPDELRRSDLVIDAAYGTGFRGAWNAPKVTDTPVLAVDIPSGIHALTGCAGSGVLAAERTVTFQALKPGHLFGAGALLCGVVELVDIGLDVSGATQHRVDANDVAEWWPTRAAGSHKWNGAVRVVAGSRGMPGAARLCAAAAARAGAGLVKLSMPGMDTEVRSEVVQHHVAFANWDDDVLADIDRFGSLVIGPGLGRAHPTIDAIRATIAGTPIPVVVDGDALFALASGSGGALAVLSDRTASTVITPHDGEFAVLTGTGPGPDRVEATRRLAGDLGCTVLLKGPATVIADPGGDVLVVDHGDQRLATAGTGDVLAGMIGAALAGGATPLHAAAAGAWLHADAARLGPVEGILAADLVDALPMALAGVR